MALDTPTIIMLRFERSFAPHFRNQSTGSEDHGKVIGPTPVPSTFRRHYPFYSWTNHFSLQSKGKNPKVAFKTTMGNIQLELFPAKAPLTVGNFLAYVNSGFYDGVIFHRVIPNFMIQGGGFTPGMKKKPTKPPIKNEAGNRLANKRGTIAMARTNEINSATSEFFINVVNNAHLDHQNNSADGFGYCVFGRVIKGMDVVDQIARTKTHVVPPFTDVPVDDVVIISAKQIQ